MKPEEFLRSTYKMILIKMDTIINIQKQATGKLPLELLKKKYEETSKILKVLTELIKTIDYNSEHGPALACLLYTSPRPRD